LARCASLAGTKMDRRFGERLTSTTFSARRHPMSESQPDFSDIDIEGAKGHSMLSAFLIAAEAFQESAPVPMEILEAFHKVNDNESVDVMERLTNLNFLQDAL